MPNHIFQTRCMRSWMNLAENFLFNCHIAQHCVYRLSFVQVAEPLYMWTLFQLQIRPPTRHYLHLHSKTGLFYSCGILLHFFIFTAWLKNGQNIWLNLMYWTVFITSKWQVLKRILCGIKSNLNSCICLNGKFYYFKNCKKITVYFRA